MISRTNFFFLPFLLLFSCGNQSISTTGNESNPDPLTIDLNQGDLAPVPKIEENKTENVGPAPKENESFIDKKSKVTEVLPKAIILGPGVYRTISHISLLRELNVQGEKPNLILGHGLAAIISAYYAFGYKPDYIEWKFFKFFNEIDDERLFSKNWLEKAKKYLLNELEGKRIEGGKLTLVVPVWNEKTNSVKYLIRGNLTEALVANLDHKGFMNKDLRPAFPYGIFDKNQLESLGIKKFYVVDLLSEGISWSRGDGFYNGIFEKGAYQTAKAEDGINGFIKYDLKDFKIDDLTRLADLVYLSKKQSRVKLKIFKEEESK
ncbi:MAG: hypothetical protein NXH75_04570 [Halobacteriovoraceae bacterium]|nr:hypothetical protein [Halobacteriovoraceae bacterium]